MSALAQRITTSHKEAAKRAVAHLGKTRKLKLSTTESLELVACVLGVANWQTLRALAEDGRGPRIDDGKPAPTQAAPAEDSIARRLADYYETPTGGWGEHPQVSLEDWQLEVENDDTRIGYWVHVEKECERKGIMLPWERDAMFDYKLTQLAGVAVEWDSDGEEDESDWLITDPWGYIFETSGSSEKDALKKAASSILGYVSDRLNMRAVDFERITEAQWLAATARVHAPLLASVRRSDLPSDELDNGYSLLPGEMTKDSRKFSEDVGLCRELGIKAEYLDVHKVAGLYWSTGKGRFFPTEAGAWKAEVNRLRTKVTFSLGVAPEVWDTAYDLDTKIKLAKQFCDWLSS